MFYFMYNYPLSYIKSLIIYTENNINHIILFPAGDDRASVSSGVADHESSHDSSVVDVGEDIRLQAAMESDESF